MFDKDCFSDDSFNNAIHKAESRGFNVAYSNQAFEYWFILHFNDHQGDKLRRNRYNRLINDAVKPFGVTYDGEGCKIVTPELFNLLMSTDPSYGKSRYQLAIDRAKRIYDRLPHNSPAEEKSSTAVFKLIERIRNYKDY